MSRCGAQFRFSETLRLFALREPGPIITRGLNRKQDSHNSADSAC